MSTKYVRSRDGSVIHLRACRYVKSSTAVHDWEWAGDDTPEQLRHRIFEADWLHMCSVCLSTDDGSVAP
jgi:hypothetical protein